MAAAPALCCVRDQRLGPAVPDFPGNLASRDDILQLLLLFVGVHTGPEAVVDKTCQLALFDQALKRLIDQLLARSNTVENLALEYEEATVDPHLRLPDIMDRGDQPIVLGRDEM